MNVIEEFLQQEADTIEARKYRERAKEYNLINKIIDEIEQEEINKKAIFKQQLEKAGIHINDEE